MLRRFIQDTRGASALEYGILVALVTIVLIAVLGPLGRQMLIMFFRIFEPLVA